MAYEGQPEPNEANFNFEASEYSPSPPLAANFDFAAGLYYLLAGTSNYFTAVWADPDASLTEGKFYALSAGPGAALTVINLDTKSINDRYTETLAGRGNETLNNTDSVDLNI
jgi:hypothetical protein